MALALPKRTPDEVLKIFLSDYEHNRSKSQFKNDCRIAARFNT